MNFGNSSTNGLQSGQPYSAPVPISPSNASSVTSSHPPALQVPSFPAASPLAPAVSLNDRSDPINSHYRVANLVKPSSFLTPSSSSPLLTPPVSSISTVPLHPMLNLQQPHGAPMLQPFPPPTPPPSLTANPISMTDCGPLNREKVRDALVMLVQVFGLSFLHFILFYFLLWLTSQLLFLKNRPLFLGKKKKQTSVLWFTF